MHYQLQTRDEAIEKLNQFPRGTTFVVPGRPQGADQELFEDLVKAGAAHGIVVRMATKEEMEQQERPM